MSSGTDYTQLIKRTWEAIIQKDNLIITLVGGVVLTLASSFTLGVLAGPLFLGYALACLKIARGQPVAMDDLWTGFSRLVPALITSLLIGIGAFIGFLLCFVPGLIVMILCTFVFYLMADDPELSGMDAIKKSAALVKANTVDVAIVWGIGVVISSLLSVTVIGAVAALAFCSLMSAFLYDELRRREGEGAMQTSL